MKDTFPNKDDKKLSTPPKRSIRNIPLTIKDGTENRETSADSIHLSVKEQESDFAIPKKQQSEPIVEKHLVPKYKDSDYEDQDVLPADQISNRSYAKSASNTDIEELSHLESAPIESGAEDAVFRIHTDNDEATTDTYKISSETNSSLNEIDEDEIEEPIKAIPVVPRKPASRSKSSDGIKVNKRTSSNIRREPAFESRESFDELDDGNDATTTSFEPLHTKHHSGTTKKIFALLVVGLLIAIALAHTVFSRATVSIKTVGQPVTLNSQTLSEKIPYQSFTKNGSKTVSVGAVSTVTVSKKASGDIVIYNNFSTTPQEFIKTTRFETANGSIFRLMQDVTVPGKKTVNGKDVPGSVSAKVEADQAGPEFNAKGGLELRLPGLIKGTEKYTKIYANVAATFTGGVSGTAPDTTSGNIQEAVTKAKAEYEAQVISELNSSNPGLTWIKDSITTTTSIGTIKGTGSDSTVTINLTTKAIGLESTSLKNAIGNINPEKKSIPTPEDLALLTYDIKETPNKDILEGTFTVAVSGTFNGKTELTTEQIKESIAGKGLTQARNQLDLELPGSEVMISTWPFWKNSMPTNTSHINITLQ